MDAAIAVYNIPKIKLKKGGGDKEKHTHKGKGDRIVSGQTDWSEDDEEKRMGRKGTAPKDYKIKKKRKKEKKWKREKEKANEK